jgi:hypothetical protein
MNISKKDIDKIIYLCKNLNVVGIIHMKRKRDFAKLVNEKNMGSRGVK